MKNLIKIFTAFLIISIFQKNAFSQADVSGIAGHAGFGFPAYYVGWDNLTNFALNIEHRGSYDIAFKLGGAQLVTIKGTGYLGGAPGSVGIGTVTPLALLNINSASYPQSNVFRTDVPGSVFTSQWDMYHGPDYAFSITDISAIATVRLGNFASGASARSLTFMTNGGAQGIITTAGDFGIGTLVPNFKLDVNGR